MSHRTDNRTPRLLQGLFERIHREEINNEQVRRRRHCFEQTRYYSLLCVLSIFFIQPHTLLYNSFADLFHANQERPATLRQTYKQDLSPFRLRFFPLHGAWLQIEIDEDQLQRKQPFLLRVSDDKDTRRTILATIIVIQSTIKTQNSTFRRFYRFRAFTTRALRCAVRHFGTRSTEYLTWVEKSMYVQAIERHYSENVTHFNRLVAPACGMRIGYLSRSKGALIHVFNSPSAYVFDSVYIDSEVSSAHSPVATFFSCLLICGFALLSPLFHPIGYLFHLLRPPQFVPYYPVRRQLKNLNLDSLEALDELLIATAEERQYHHRLYIIREQYLVILHLDWNECNPDTLRQFRYESPFTVYAIAWITKVLEDRFYIRSREHETWIRFPTAMHGPGISEGEWLHGQMMSLSEEYWQR